ncbi:hypothetical protein [Pseudomonas oryzihabitans]|uniref:hypothetical protein n=1 Tax=Pseudomonas oryzihabitans TaxID=47885 RepID=UPI000ACD1AA6|nr:hypothetical protein [Pseudomonas psychrotolerans]
MSIPKPFLTPFGRRAADFEQALSLSQENAMPAAASGLSLYGIKAWNAMVNQAKPS